MKFQKSRSHLSPRPSPPYKYAPDLCVRSRFVGLLACTRSTRSKTFSTAWARTASPKTRLLSLALSWCNRNGWWSRCGIWRNSISGAWTTAPRSRLPTGIASARVSVNPRSGRSWTPTCIQQPKSNLDGFVPQTLNHSTLLLCFRVEIQCLTRKLCKNRFKNTLDGPCKSEEKIPHNCIVYND